MLSLFLKCNFRPADLPFDNLPKFYRDCLTAWSTINNKVISSRKDVLEEIIWNNQHLRIENKPIFSNKLLQKEIAKVSDILFDNGKLRSWDHFRSNGLNFNEYLMLFGLSKALPLPWKNLLNTANVNLRQQQNRSLEFPLQLGDDVVNLPLLISKKLYWHLVAQARVSPTSMHKYNTLFPNHIIKWDQIFLIPFKVTLDVRTRCFQFNLLHRIVYTNNLLYKMNFTISNLCSFCEEAEESLEHLFFECKASQDFWKSVIS